MNDIVGDFPKRFTSVAQLCPAFAEYHQRLAALPDEDQAPGVSRHTIAPDCAKNTCRLCYNGNYFVSTYIQARGEALLVEGDVDIPVTAEYTTGNGEVKTRSEYQTQRWSLKHMLDYLAEKWEFFMSHAHRGQVQDADVAFTKRNVPIHGVVTTQDFAMGYSFQAHRQEQSGFFSPKSATLYMTIIYAHVDSVKG